MTSNESKIILWGVKPLPETDASLLPIGPLGTNFNEIWIKKKSFAFKDMHLKMSSAKRQASMYKGSTEWLEHVDSIPMLGEWMVSSQYFNLLS